MPLFLRQPSTNDGGYLSLPWLCHILSTAHFYKSSDIFLNIFLIALSHIQLDLHIRSLPYFAFRIRRSWQELHCTECLQPQSPAPQY